jgi:hypothetical protein
MMQATCRDVYEAELESLGQYCEIRRNLCIELHEGKLSNRRRNINQECDADLLSGFGVLLATR